MYPEVTCFRDERSPLPQAKTYHVVFISKFGHRNCYPSAVIPFEVLPVLMQECLLQGAGFGNSVPRTWIRLHCATTAFGRHASMHANIRRTSGVALTCVKGILPTCNSFVACGMMLVFFLAQLEEVFAQCTRLPCRPALGRDQSSIINVVADDLVDLEDIMWHSKRRKSSACETTSHMCLPH